MNAVFQRILSGRGLETAAQVDYRLANLLAPDQIKNLPKAASLVAHHIEKQHHILIFGDYDADGATSTAMCVKALTMLGHKRVSYLMPDRLIEGYGLSLSVAKRIAGKQPDCVITVDSGISSLPGIALLTQQNIDIVVTDHHLPGQVLPNASVIVNQNAWGDTLPGKNLAGVGIAFYLMMAVRKTLRELNWFDSPASEPNLASCLDLVAIGTLADLVPLDYHNRILVNEGLNRIRAGLVCEGVRALIDISNKSAARLTSSDVGFTIAPKINAAGRLDDMTIGVQCLLAEDAAGANQYAQQLNAMNELRKTMQTQMADEAKQRLQQLPAIHIESRQGIVLYQQDWHEGIVGIVAARIREQYHRPSIVFADSGDGTDTLKGSGRSIPGIHLRDMLDRVDKRYPGIILKFGGHAMAAGLSLESSGLDSFSAAFQQVIAESADPACFRETIEHDGELGTQYLDLEFAESLQQLSPWGQGFPVPSFVGEFSVTSQRVLTNKHLKLVLELPVEEDTSPGVIDAIAFFQADSILQKSYEKIRIHYELDINRYRGQSSVQLIIRDIL